MPAIRRRPDKLVRVAKVEPYTGASSSVPSKASGASTSNNPPLVGVPLDGGTLTGTAPPSSSAPGSGAAAKSEASSSTPAAPKAKELSPREQATMRAATSAADWNSLLIWARRQRGPQWDAATGIWQVDKHSEEYYSFCSNPTQSLREDPNSGVDPISSGLGGSGGIGGAENGAAAGTGTGAGASVDDSEPILAQDLSSTGGAGADKSLDRDGSPPPVGPGRSSRLRAR